MKPPSWLLRGVRISGIVVFAIFSLGSVVLGVVALVDSSRPVIWGTFSGESCIPTARGCNNIGSWVSDDGEVRLDDVRLDGSRTPVDSVRAAYRVGATFGGDTIVHTAEWIGGAPWALWLLAVVCIVTTVVQIRRLGPARREAPRHAVDSP
ncbi:hypothetical protein HDC94_001298 [Leifsonia sp. AK011]|uniref:hypothetical protein n=1 Tax=Leifsonia sp. AK011 TaxID=2723075 RepID=UPI0015CC307A|nr:hypothetical protein [Leifsonia sp. AK011]NYF10142.1 hypothetical protein [Leifsonia sp. AK011]